MSDAQDIFVVGVAASAGGLEAVSLLAGSLPGGAPAVYVVAQHMSPKHRSLLTSLISRETRLPVREIKDDIRLEPGSIFITPPNSDVEIEGDRLRLREPSGHHATPKPSADRLFKSMADQRGEHCVGIVLSGTGSDGSYGVQSIREAGGITIAQEPSSAKYDGMPVAALETGCVDLTLNPEQIGEHLEKILSSPRDFAELKRLNDRPSKLSDLLHILFARTRVDFRDYKETTINRRIARRMLALGINDYDDYVVYCRSNVDEVDALYRDLLISVTRFFRDPKQFERLAQVIAEMVERKAPDDPMRIWAPGCATGEEAYSIAILVAEALGGPGRLEKERVQIFATDIDERALEIAKAGSYPITAAADIPQPYLERYFKLSSEDITARRELKAAILFSRHNITQDPPFINLDMISLRNLLIYFTAHLQERVLMRMHYALKPNGMLFLGTSESVGAMDNIFEAKSPSDKVFRKRAIGRRVAAPGVIELPPGKSARVGRAAPGATEPEDELFLGLARSVAPMGFLTDRDGDMLRVFGDITAMMDISELAQQSLTARLLRGGLREEAAGLMAVCARHRERREGRWIKLDGPGFDEARVICHPVLGAEDAETRFLIGLETRMSRRTDAPAATQSERERSEYIRQIEHEMETTREALQQTVEELQTTNEELQSANEELQSTNEELQSTNEELETSNEELQSTNEELITVNEELLVNSTELQRVSTELSATLFAAPFPILVIDPALQIRRASKKALSYFALGEIPQNGLHLSQCTPPSGLPPLTAFCSEAFDLRGEKSAVIENGARSARLTVAPFFDQVARVLGLTLSVIPLSDQSEAAPVAPEKEEG